MNKYVLVEADSEQPFVAPLVAFLEDNQEDEELEYFLESLLEGFPIYLGGGAQPYVTVTPIWSQTFH